jgi:hypothetical protein
MMIQEAGDLQPQNGGAIADVLEIVMRLLMGSQNDGR